MIKNIKSGFIAKSKESFKNKLLNLVSGFKQIEKRKEIETINEATIRSEFIDPLFEALGWDVYNRRQEPHKTKEVIREENLNEQTQTKPDYIFRIGGIPYFIVEAKKPSEDLLTDKGHIFQTKKYAYSASIPLAILTDFQEFRLFDCTLKPHFEAPERGVIKKFDLTYLDYSKKLDLLYTTFSFIDASKGSLMKLLSEVKNDNKIHTIEDFLFNLKGIEPVSEEFLEDLSVWRDNIARSLAGQNKGIDEDLLNESTQRLLDRLVFIRVCEDRGIERKEILKETINQCAKESGNLMDYLRTTFRDFDKKYNGLLFKEHPLEKMSISSEMLSDVISNLYTPKSPYQFDVIDVQVLGHIYEKFLSKRITLLPNGKIDITESREIKKEEGIFYTNKAIVQYIIRNTLGEKLKDCEIGEVDNIKILDPACGSGSFLLEAFQALINFYTEHYQQNISKYTKNTEDFFLSKNKEIILTPSKKAKILLNNLHGVDLDPKAVEVTSMSLYLKILEGDYQDYLFRHFHLPIIDDNIKCGNSLIGFDLLEKATYKQGDLYRNYREDLTEKYKLFDWESSFNSIFQKGGFDVIIGNPPYGAKFDDIEKSYFEKHYPDYSEMKNSALLFMDKVEHLIKPNGIIGLIVPKSLAFSQKWKIGRELIKEGLIKLVDVGKAWKEVKLEQIIYIYSNELKSDKYKIDYFNNGKRDLKSKSQFYVTKEITDKTDTLILESNDDFENFFIKLNRSNIYLKNISKTFRGLPWQKELVKKKTKFKVFRGKHIQRYFLSETEDYLPEEFVHNNKQNMNLIDEVKVAKIVSQRIVAHRSNQTPKLMIASTLDLKAVITVDTVENTVLTSTKYPINFILALLNSNLIAWYAYYYIFSNAIRSMDLDNYYVGKIPLADNKKVDKSFFKSSVSRIIEIKQQLQNLKTENIEKRKTEEVLFLEREINKAIYGAYGLNKNEVKIIENTM